MATRADVARAAGVSEAAVSYALSGKRAISAPTRERILAAMDDLDYRPNAMARGLAGGRSAIIALLFPIRERGMSNADLEYVLGAADASRELGYHLLLWPTDARDVEDAQSMARSGLIDGVLLMEVTEDDERIDGLREAGVRVGLIGRTEEAHDDVTAADRDFEEATEIAVRHLAELGHRGILFVDGSESAFDSGSAAMRRAERGFRDACRRHGVRARVERAEATIDAGRWLYEHLLTPGSPLTGVVSLNAEAAMGILAAANTGASRVPDSLSIVSIGTPRNLARATVPELTTVSPPAYEIGRAAARMLIDRVAGLGLEPERTLWAGELEVRGSTGPAA